MMTDDIICIKGDSIKAITMNYSNHDLRLLLFKVNHLNNFNDTLPSLYNFGIHLRHEVVRRTQDN